ncbi:MAG: DeoR family transcriptional regulator, partial [Clostridiales bacterium]|nr:DeoR family transcriptional regulator [Clostridiales bacterium]
MSRGNEESVFAEERKHLIVELVNKQVKTTVAQLCDEFKVSPATVRNDLRELEFAGLLKRTHGGAISNRKTNYEPTFYEKLVERIDEKRAIAEAAAAMVQDGDTVAIDSGTTTLELAKHLTHVQNLTVVTYDLQVATFLERNSQATIILMGGILRRDLFYTSGPMTITALQGLNVDRVFLSTNGVAAGKGVTSPNMDQAKLKEEMVHIGDEVLVQRPQPYLRVQVVRTLKYSEDIAFDVQKEQDSKQYTTYEKVKTKGVNGSKDVVAEIVLVDGVEQSRR